MDSKALFVKLSTGEFDKKFAELYGMEKIPEARERYAETLKNYVELYGDSDDIRLLSVGGRTEVMGNHTDHNFGEVIAASVERDIIAAAARCDGDTVYVKSEGHSEDVVSLNELKPCKDRFFNASELVRGMLSSVLSHGYEIGAFRAYTHSFVPSGSGLSSSAAYEVMIGNIINNLFNGGKIDNIEIAKYAQYAENVFFGKPCGLMDQMACAVGGMIHIDFADPTSPVIEKINIDGLSSKYAFCIVYPGGSHANLNDEYAAIPQEMRSVAEHLGKKVLREISDKDVIRAIPSLRESVGDRAILRALHFLWENQRVSASVKALKEGNTEKLLENITLSGESSFKYLQNIYAAKDERSQGLSLAIALSDMYFSKRGVHVRVHGGGFAGTVLAVLPKELTCEYSAFMEKCFGKGSCITLSLRKYGAISLF